MKQYILRRIIISFIVLIGVSILLYTLVRLMPADYVSLSTSTSSRITDEQRDHLRSIYGLDKGIVEGYIDWVTSALQGDLGVSLTRNRPVSEIIGEYAPITFSISFIALIFELLIAIPVGILAARKPYSKVDYLVTTLVFIGISLPIFFIAAIFKRIFGFYGLNILPTSGMLTARVIYPDHMTLAKFIDYAKHLILPITCFVVTGVGSYVRYVRSNMLEALSSDYVRTARAKGVSEHRVVYSHAFRNTLIPIVTLLGGSLPSLFSGAAVTEGIFAIEGLGNIALSASHFVDVPYLMGFNIFLALLTIIGYLLTDILYAVVDPRVRLS